MIKNQKVTPDEIAKIRGLDDFDLIMLISEIHDHGWLMGRCTLSKMPGMATLTEDEQREIRVEVKRRIEDGIRESVQEEVRRRFHGRVWR
jgi:hypothetical protein